MLLQSVEIKFSILESLYRTCQLSSSIPSNRWMIHYGQYIDEDDMDYFFDDIATKEESVKSMRRTLGRLRKVRHTFDKLRIDETEVAALSGVLLWNEAALLMPTWEPCNQIREQILGELHNYLIGKHGLGGTGSRIGSLMCCIHELNCVSREIQEHKTMEKIFNPSASHGADIWNIG